MTIFSLQGDSARESTDSPRSALGIRPQQHDLRTLPLASQVRIQCLRLNAHGPGLGGEPCLLGARVQCTVPM